MENYEPNIESHETHYNPLRRQHLYKDYDIPAGRVAGTGERVPGYQKQKRSKAIKKVINKSKK